MFILVDHVQRNVLSHKLCKLRRRENKRGEPYGMGVSLLQPPETIWGYDWLSSAYGEAPSASWQRLFDRIMALFPGADDREIARLVGRRPRD